VVNYQWGIFWANLNPSKGSEQAGIRPVLVISVDEVNNALPIVTIISITSLTPGRKIYPTEVLLKVENTGLPKDSVAMAHQIRAISKDRLGEKCGEISSDNLKLKIRNSIRIYLGI